jgi:N-hydroxyarylamine O-acetyltransferase
MIADNFNLATYFKRIGFNTTPGKDLATVTKMMRQQLFTVPFENLDIQAGKGVSLVPETIVEKIIQHHRGGYCYEVNGLFAMALQALEIPYQFIACRPMFYPTLRPRTHMALIVNLEGTEWLCDVGFGSNGIRAPLSLSSTGCEIQQDYERYRLDHPNNREYLLKSWDDGQWVNQYAFDLWPQQWVDYLPANHLNATHPESVFVQKLLVVLHNPEGRCILFGDRLKIVKQGVIQTSLIPPNRIPEILRDHFGLTRNQ